MKIDTKIEHIDVQGVNLSGNSVTFKGVPAHFSDKYNDYLINLDDLGVLTK